MKADAVPAAGAYTGQLTGAAQLANIIGHTKDGLAGGIVAGFGR